MKLHLAIAAMLALAAAVTAKTVKVTDFNPKPEDATAAIQAAFDSDATTVIIDNPGFEYLTLPLTLASNQEVVIQDGVVIRAKPNEYKDTSSFMFFGKGVTNLTVRGEGNATVCMNKKDYQNLKEYKHSEWRHAFSLFGAKNVTIRDLAIASSGGDGVYIAYNSKDILLENLDIRDHHRQGISVISATNLTVRKCRIYGTKGTAPEAGIDFEPNRRTDHIINNLVEDCDIYDNAGNGIDFAFGDERLLPVSITIRNCRLKNNRGGELDLFTGFQKPGLGTQGAVKIENCTVNAAYHYAIAFQDPHEDGPVVSFKDTYVNATQLKTPPLQFVSKIADDITNINFENTVIENNPAVPVIKADALGIAAFKAPRGALTIRQNGKDTHFDFEPIVAAHPGMPQFKNFQPAQLDLKGLTPAFQTAENGKPIQLRSFASLLQYATPEKTVNITFNVSWTRLPDGEYDLTVLDPDGKRFDIVKIKCPQHTYALKAKKAGVYRLNIRTQDRGVQVTSDAPGLAYCADQDGLKSFRSNHAMYFEVPADLTDVMLKFSTQRGEGMRVELSDENGKVLETTDYFESVRYIHAKRTPTPAPVLWKIRQFKVVEDNGVQLGAPIRPILYTSPTQLLH